MLRSIIPARLKRSGPTIPVVRLHGPIGALGPLRQGLTLDRVNPVLEKAFQRKHVPAVAIVINSPGGSAVQSSLIHDRIRQLAAKKETKVLTFCEDVAASGGYWLAAAGDEIFANENSIVGSIGVVAAGFGFVEAIDKLGIQRRVYTAGDNKVILDPFQPEKKQDVARLKALQGDIHDAFKTLVRNRRGGALNGDDKEMFSGAFWTGARARDLGLVDGVGNLHDILAQRFGKDVRVKHVQTSSGFGLKRLFGFPGAAASQLDAGALPEAFLDALETRALWQRFGL